jgi:hypothetical protein
MSSEYGILKRNSGSNAMRFVGSSRGSSIGSGSLLQNFITEDCENTSVLVKSQYAEKIKSRSK